MVIFHSYVSLPEGNHLVIFASASWTVPRGIWHWYLIYFSLWEKSRPKRTNTICRLQPRNHRTENGCFASNWIVWVFNMSNSSWVVLESQNRFMGIYHPLITKKTTVRIRWASFLHPDLGGNRFVTPSPVDATLQVYQVKKWSSHIWWVICWGNNHVWWHMMRGGNVVPWRWRGFSQTRGAKFGQPGGWWEKSQW